MNREPLATGEHYHIYNRGVDKREIFPNEQYVDRFLLCMQVFNSIDPILSLRDAFEIRAEDNLPNRQKLVEVVAYCLNPNHYHFILEQLVDGGIAEFMKRLNGGYTWYFNKRHARNGALLQGAYKSSHVDENERLLELSAYVNLNDKVHQIGGETAVVVRSSWGEYVDKDVGFCKKSLILDQFNDDGGYKKFALEALPTLLERKKEEKELTTFLLEI